MFLRLCVCLNVGLHYMFRVVCLFVCLHCLFYVCSFLRLFVWLQCLLGFVGVDELLYVSIACFVRLFA